MTDTLRMVIVFLLALGPLVFIHELGHFLVAKGLRIGAPVFSLGFGPRLFGFRRDGTDYRVSAIPLGGYVRLQGDEADESRVGAPEEFLTRPRWQRFLVFVAGAAFNVLLAFALMWVYFGVYGVPVKSTYPTVIGILENSSAEAAGVQKFDKLIELAGIDLRKNMMEAESREILLAPDKTQELIVERDGQRLTLQLETGNDDGNGADPGWAWSTAVVPEIGMVSPDGRAAEAGIEVGDVIVSADGNARISEVELRELLENSPERAVTLGIERAGVPRDIVLTPADVDGKGRIGVTFRASTVEHDVWMAASASFNENVQLSKTLFVFLFRLVKFDVSAKNVSGPIGIAVVADQVFQLGPQAILRFLAFLSLQLGIINLLPIPVLDGGHILILMIESVMRRDLSDVLKERVMQVGLVFLLVLMTTVIVSDFFKHIL